MATDAQDDPFRAAGLLIGSEPGKVFLAKRSPWTAEPSTWGIPGGCCHVGEDSLAAAVRECREEFGSVPPFVVKRSTSWKGPKGFVYVTFVVVVTPETRAAWKPVLNDEHQEAGWFDLDRTPVPVHQGVKDALTSLAKSGLTKSGQVR